MKVRFPFPIELSKTTSLILKITFYKKQYKKFVNNGVFITQLALKRYILGTIGTLLTYREA